MRIRIRFAATVDFDRLERIEDRADALLAGHFAALRPGEPDFAWLPEPAAQRAAAPGFTLVAVLDDESGEAIGFVQVLEIAEGARRIAHLEQLSVLPDHGRRGYGRRLLEAAATATRERGHAELTLRTFADVPWNAPFYARCGFVESLPETAFHRGLVETERRLGLAALGRRVQMTLELS